MTLIPGRRRLVCLGWLVALQAALLAQAPPRDLVLDVAFSQTMFGGVNPNDARAAIAVWADTLARQAGVTATVKTDIYADSAALLTSVAAGQVNLVITSLNDYRRMDHFKSGSVLLGDRRQRHAEELYLLAKKGRFTKLADLKGRSLIVQDGISRDMSLAWLETALLEAGLGSLDGHFGSVTAQAKPARTVLPVFFGQADACLLSAYSYELMVELNPQIGSTLAVVAASPPLVHAIVSFDRRFDNTQRERVYRAMLTLHESPTGQQVLSLFGLERLIPGTPADLGTSLALLERHERLMAAHRGGQ